MTGKHCKHEAGDSSRWWCLRGISTDGQRCTPDDDPIEDCYEGADVLTVEEGETLEGVYNRILALRGLHPVKVDIAAEIGYRIVTVIPPEADRKAYHEAERDVYSLFPLLRLDFQCQRNEASS